MFEAVHSELPDKEDLKWTSVIPVQFRKALTNPLVSIVSKLGNDALPVNPVQLWKAPFNPLLLIVVRLGNDTLVNPVQP